MKKTAGLTSDFLYSKDTKFTGLFRGATPVKPSLYPHFSRFIHKGVFGLNCWRFEVGRSGGN